LFFHIHQFLPVQVEKFGLMDFDAPVTLLKIKSVESEAGLDTNQWCGWRLMEDG
jgi:hypothetical protein